jgi:hypothetical protein
MSGNEADHEATTQHILPKDTYQLSFSSASDMCGLHPPSLALRTLFDGSAVLFSLCIDRNRHTLPVALHNGRTGRDRTLEGWKPARRPSFPFSRHAHFFQPWFLSRLLVDSPFNLLIGSDWTDEVSGTRVIHYISVLRLDALHRLPFVAGELITGSACAQDE